MIGCPSLPKTQKASNFIDFYKNTTALPLLSTALAETTPQSREISNQSHRDGWESDSSKLASFDRQVWTAVAENNTAIKGDTESVP
jgi:hypothetical protein